MNNFKRFLSLALAVLMTLSYAPTIAYATDFDSAIDLETVEEVVPAEDEVGDTSPDSVIGSDSTEEGGLVKEEIGDTVDPMAEKAIIVTSDELKEYLENSDYEYIYLRGNATIEGTITIPDGVTRVLDLQGNTLTGNILATNANLTIKDGSIVNNDSSKSALEINAGTLTLTNVNIESARHAVRIDGEVTATINGGNYTLKVNSGMTQHAVNISGSANVTIEDGTFVGPKGTTADSGAAVNVQSGATVTIENGNFSGGKNNTLASKGTLIIEGGDFDQLPDANWVQNLATITVTSEGVSKEYVKNNNELIDLETVVAVTKDENGDIDRYYTTLAEAMGKFNGRTVYVLRDVTEEIEGFYGVTLISDVEGGVTITTTYEDWVDFDDVTVSENVTVEIPNAFSGDSENVIKGTLNVSGIYYHGYDAKTTVQKGGSITVGDSTILRFNEETDSGIYIYGDGDDSTVEFDCDYYIGAYSGTFYAKDANVECGYFLLKNSYDNDDYADIAMTLDNSSLTVVGTTDGQDSFIIDDKASLTLKNSASIKDVRDFKILAGAKLTLSVDETSSISATNVEIASDVPLESTKNTDGTVTFARPTPTGGDIIGYTSETTIWGETWGNAFESYVVKVLDAEGNVMGTTSLNNVGGIIDGDVYVTWSLKLDAESNTDEYWTMEWTTAPTINNLPKYVALVIDGTEVSRSEIKLNGPDGQNPVFAAKTDAYGKILSFIACDGYNLNNASQKLISSVVAGDHVAILKAGTYSVPTGKNLTITGAVDGVVFECGQNNIGMNGASVTFNNVTFNWANNGWPYHGLAHCGEMEYNNCIFNGTVFLYGTSETFNSCEFNVTGDTYNVWTYGAKEVEFNECTFNCDGKSVLIYSEDSTLFNEVTVTDCKFIASAPVAGKAAIEMDSSLTAGISLTIDGETTATGFGTGNVSGNSLWNNKKGNEGKNNDITVVVNGIRVLGPAFAQIGENIYASLEEANEAAQSGDKIILLDNITLTETLTTTAGITLNSNGFAIDGSLTAGGDLTIEGHLKVTSFSAGSYNHITIGEDACLEVTGGDRVTIGWGNTFNITGSITDAKTTDKTEVKPSLIIPGGISITGSGATFNVTNAYIQLGLSTSKNSAATDTFDFDFTNSIVDFTNNFSFATSTSGKTPVFDIDVKDSVLNLEKNLDFSNAACDVLIDNSVVTVGSSMRNDGTLKLTNGSEFTVKAQIQSGEHGGNNGIITVDASTLTIECSSIGHAMDGNNVGKLEVVNGGEANIDYIIETEIYLDGDDSTLTSKSEELVIKTGENYGYKCENKDDGTYIYTTFKAQAKIGDVRYENLLDALAAAQDGETVVMLNDVELNTRLIFSSYTKGKNVTLDGNNHKLYASSNNWGTGNGKHLINVNCDNVTLKDIVLDSNNIAEGVNIYKAQNIVFENVTIINKKGYNADLTVNGSTLTVKGKLSASYVDVDLGSGVTTPLGIVADEGATLDVRTLAIDSAAYPNTNLDKALSTDGTSYYSIKKLDSDGNLAGYTNSLSRLSNGYGYKLLEDVTVTSNVPILNAGHTGTIDLNGNDLTINSGKTITVNGELTITGEGSVNGEFIFGNKDATIISDKAISVTTTVGGGTVIYDKEKGIYRIAIYVAKIGETYYETLAEALAAAADDDTVELIWADGSDPIAMNGSVYGKTVTITGTATVDWSKGFLFIGRGGEGNGTVIFDNANLTSASDNASTGIHVSGREKNTDNKYDGTLTIKNSTIELDYLINKGTMTLDNSTLTVKNGFSVGGRPASETESGEDATATITLNNSKLVVNNHNGMGLGYEAIGIMNVNSGSTFETTQNFLITAKGTMNVNGGTVKVTGTLTNNGTVNVAGGTVKVTETLANAGTVNVSGVSDIAATVTGAGWVYMNDVTLDADTKLYGAKVRFASGTNNIDGSIIDDGFFQVGIGAYKGVDANVDTADGVIVNVKNATIGSKGSTYAGWIGTGFYDTDAEKAAVMTNAKYVLNIENSIAEFGYLHISNDGELNVKGDAATKAHYNNSDYSFYAGDFIINGTATFDATDVLALYTKVSCDNGTATPGTLNIVNGTSYEAERHNGAIDGTNFILYKTGVVNVNGAELYIGEYSSIAADAEFNIGGTVTALGTITNNGTITLTDANATLTTPEAPEVVSGLKDYKVKYEDGAYKLVEKVYVAKIGEDGYETLEEAVAAVQEGETIQLLAGTFEEGTIKLPATLKNVTFKGAEGAVLKDMTIMAADGNSISYEGLTFDGIVFENSRIMITGWRTGGASVKDLTVTNCEFKNLNDTTNNAPLHINMDATEAVENLTFTNNVIDGATGGTKSGVYAQATGKVIFTDNTINNVAFRPYVIQLTTDDGIADEFIVTGNTFSGSATGRAQGLGNNAEGTDTVKLVVSENVFKGITDAQQICYWNFNPETTTANLSKNYYDIDILEKPNRIYYNKAATGVEDLIGMGIFPYYEDEAKTTLVDAPAIMVTYGDGIVEYFYSMTDAVPNSNKNTMDGATIKLLGDYTGAGVRFFDDVTLDLNGYTYTVTKSAGSKGTETSGFQLRPESNGVTIKNGTIAVAEETEGNVVWLLNSYTNLTLENVTLDCTNLAESYGDFRLAVILHDGENKITGLEVKNFEAEVAPISVSDNANYDGGVSLTIDGFDGEIKLSSGEATICGPENLNIVSGNEAYIVVYENGVYYTALAVAQVGETKYKSLKEALEAAENGDEVKIIVAGTYALSTSGKDLTITGAVDGVVFDNIGAKNMGGANVTFNNVTFDYYPNVNYTGLQHSGNLVYNNCIFNGQVFLYGASETFNSCTFNQNSADAYNVWTYGAKEVEFNECTFNCVGKSVLIYAEGANISNDVTVTDCDFIASAPVEGKAAIEMDSSLTAGISLTIDGETTATGFGTGNVSGNSLWNNKKDNKTEANNDITVTVNGETVLKPLPLVAETNSVNYTSLEAAIDAAQAGATVTLLDNVELEKILTIDKAITINGNGNTLTSTAGRAINIDCVGTVTIENLTVLGETGCERGINIINKAGTTTLSNVSVSGVSHYAVHVATSAGDAEVNVDGSELTGYAAIAVYGEGSEVTVTGSKLVGINSYEDNGASDFSTIAIGAKNVKVIVTGGSVSAEATKNTAKQFIFGHNSGTSDGSIVVLNTEIIIDGENVGYLNIDADEVTVSVKADYAANLRTEGWVVKADTENLVTVTSEAVARNTGTSETYATVSEALEKAKSGETVKLITNTTDGYVLVAEGVTLDLGEYALTANYVIVFNNGYITGTTIGTTSYAKLIVAKEGHFISANSTAYKAESYDILPVWNDKENCFVFSAFVIDNDSGEFGIDVDSETGEVTFKFVHKATGWVNKNLLNDGASNNGLSIRVRVEWTLSDGTSTFQDFVYSDNHVAAVASGRSYYKCVLKNYKGIEGMKIYALVLTDCGTVSLGTVYKNLG